jgi:hypothetical protein
MARASTRSVPSWRQTAQPTVSRQLRRWLRPQLRQLRRRSDAYVRTHHADRYTKRFTTWAQTCFLLFYALAHAASLRRAYASFAACPEWLRISGLDAEPAADEPPDEPRIGISFSQVAYANTRRRPGFLATLTAALVAGRPHLEPVIPGLANLLLFDSTFLALSFKLARWLPVRATTKNRGVRIQSQFEAIDDHLEYFWVSDGRKNDCTGGLDAAVLDDPARRAALRGRTLVIDLGYYSHQRFAALHAAHIHVISRLHPQATYTVVERREVQQPLWAGASGRITVCADQVVNVGSTNNRAGAVLQGWRLVEATVEPLPAAARRGKTTQTYTLLTDRWDLTALEVVQAYLWRWQIELFFRWLKSHLHLRHLLGYSRNAVQLSLELICLVQLLCALAAQALGQRRRSPALLDLLRTVFQQLTAAELSLEHEPVQLAFSGLAPPDLA